MGGHDWQTSGLKRLQVRLIAGTGAPLIRLLGSSWRWRVEGEEHHQAATAGKRPAIHAFWHGRILPGTVYFRDRGIVVITSQNFDGEWIARIIQRFGYGTARGSSSRGARKAMLQLVRDVKSHGAAFPLDGPRGPARVAQPGAVWLSKVSGNPVLPFHLEAASHWSLRSWDRTQIPKPFTTIAVVFAEPFVVPRDSDDDTLEAYRVRLEQDLAACERRCLEMVREGPVRSGKVRGVRGGSRGSIDRSSDRSTDRHIARSDRQITSSRAHQMLFTITSPRYTDHQTPPGHPERAERAVAMAAVVERFRAAGGRIVEPRAATDGDLERVHTPAHVQRVSATRGRSVMLDPDTFTSPHSEEVARFAAGAVLTAVDTVLDGAPGTRALAVVRPPGHHAEPDRAMGFCFYNNIAVGAAYARSRGAGRVAIVDFDVHHGNGTQAAFYEDPTVLFVSSHQYPYYPGTGAATERGAGAGEGYTLNLPLEAGAMDRDVIPRYEREALPLLERFAPDLLMISAGFDAHERDPLAGCRMTTAGFRVLTAMLIAAADRLCDGRVVLATEGGYDLQALGECLEAVIDVCR